MTQKITLTDNPQAANAGTGVTFVSVNKGGGFFWATTNSKAAAHFEPDNLSAPAGWTLFVWGSGEIIVSEVASP